MGRTHDTVSDTPETDACWGDRECNPHEDARRLERERDEARKEIENIKKLLLDPNAVHINMLYGQIAKLDWEKLEHIHGNHPAREQLAAEHALADRLAKSIMNWKLEQWRGTPEKATEQVMSALTAWKEARSE